MNSTNKKESSEFCEICNYFVKYIFVFILLFISLCSVLFFNLLSTAKSYAYYVNSQMSYNIYEYNEVDLEQLCRISMCKYVMAIRGNEINEFKILYKSEIRGKELIISRDEISHTPELKKLFLNYFYDEKYNIVACRK